MAGQQSRCHSSDASACARPSVTGPGQTWSSALPGLAGAGGKTWQPALAGPLAFPACAHLARESRCWVAPVPWWWGAHSSRRRLGAATTALSLRRDARRPGNGLPPPAFLFSPRPPRPEVTIPQRYPPYRPGQSFSTSSAYTRAAYSSRVFSQPASAVSACARPAAPNTSRSLTLVNQFRSLTRSTSFSSSSA